MDDGSSSDAHSSLSLSYSSSSFEWSVCSDGAAEADDTDGGHDSTAVEPYQYEPEVSDSQSSEEDDYTEENEHRLGNTAW